MKKLVPVRGLAARQLLWICDELDKTPEQFLDEIMPFHVDQILQIKAMREEQKRASERLSETSETDSGAVEESSDDRATNSSELGSGSDG